MDDRKKPGDTIKKMMDEQGMTTGRATELLDWPDGWVDDVTQGKRPIVYKMADDLARVFGFPASFWHTRLPDRDDPIWTVIKDDRIRGVICNLMSEMLDNPDEHGIYPTGRFMSKMEQFILDEKRGVAERALLS